MQTPRDTDAGAAGAVGDGINAITFLGATRLVVGTYGGWIHVLELRSSKDRKKLPPVVARSSGLLESPRTSDSLT